MMSRRKTFPSFSSSRQMMMAWKVSGLSHRPAIIASRPASMRLAIAISPSRESSSTEPISRRYMRTGSSVRSDGSFSDLTSGLAETSTSSPPSSVVVRLPSPRPRVGVFLLDHVDAHLGQHRERVLDLLGGDLLRRHHGVELLIGDVAALLGALDHLLDGGIREVEQRQRRVGAALAVLLGRLVLRVAGLGLGGGIRPWRRLSRPRLYSTIGSLAAGRASWPPACRAAWRRVWRATLADLAGGVGLTGGFGLDSWGRATLPARGAWPPAFGRQDLAGGALSQPT